MNYSGPKIGTTLQAAALRRKDRQRRNLLRQSAPLRKNWHLDLMAFAALAFAFLLTIGKVFGL